MVRIGGGQGFYGDGHLGVGPLLAEGVDYLVCEALAELTLAILAKDRARDETAGWTRDLPLYASMVAPHVVSGRTRFITNAGGINPLAAGRAVVDALRANDLHGVKVATVVGDDLRAHSATLGIGEDAVFASAYLGAAPIVEALDAGAHMVITGRVADASLFLAPLIHEFGWARDDWDRLAAGVTVGHLLECSAQVTGGNYSGDWWADGDFTQPGFPIAECEPDGTAVITKPAGTGGRVSFDTVREQLMYEVHDPAAYLNPDVTADFTSVELTDLGGDRVEVSEVRGSPRPDTYKGLVCTRAGYSGEARFPYPWPDAEAKARAGARFLRRRADQLGLEVLEWHEEYFGLNAFGMDTVELPEPGDDAAEPAEVMGRLVWRCAQRADAAALMAEYRTLGLGGPPMVSPFGRARDSGPTGLLGLEAIAVDRELVDSSVVVEIDTT
ncbi:MAG: acyclic terpene utilization AtuA family protein [Microthrixaceae bacterium]